MNGFVYPVIFFLEKAKTNRRTDDDCALLLLAAVAALPAIAFLVVVHRTVLARLFASRLVRRKRCGANHRRQNRKQDLRVIFHQSSLAHGRDWRYYKIRPKSRRHN